MNTTEETPDQPAGTSRQRIQRAATIISNAVAEAPMMFISDGGARAEHVATTLAIEEELRTRARIDRVLYDLDQAVNAGRAEAENLAEQQRDGQAEGSLAYTQGRAAAYIRVHQAIAKARAAVENPAARTREQAAHDFANQIINRTTTN